MKLFAFIIFLIFSNSILANNVDSLTRQLDLVEQEEKVDLLNELFIEVAKSSPSLAFEYGNEALNLSKKIRYEKGIADSYSNFGKIHFIQGKFNASDSLTFLAMDIYKKLEDEKGQAECHMILGSTLYRNGNPSKSFSHFDQSKNIFEKQNLQERLASL